MKPLPNGVSRKLPKPVPTRSPLRVEKLSFLARRNPTVRSPGILERRCSLSKRKSQKHLSSALSALPPATARFVSNLKETTLFSILSYPHLQFKNDIYVPKLWIFDTWHYLGRPFPSFLYSYNMFRMSTCYM